MASTAASRPRLAASLLDEGISPLSRCRAAPASSSKSIGFAFHTDGKEAKMPGVANILRHAPTPFARGLVHARRTARKTGVEGSMVAVRVDPGGVRNVTK